MRVGGIVLSGGTGARMGGVDKGALEVGGRTLLDRAVTTVAAVADPVVVVGPERPLDLPVVFTREEPPLGGPAAGLLAGARRLSEAGSVLAVLLAVDMPRVDVRTLRRLLDAVVGDGAVLVGADGRTAVCGVLSVAALLAQAPADPTGLSLRTLIGSLDVVAVPAMHDETHDIDGWRDLADVADSDE